MPFPANPGMKPTSPLSPALQADTLPPSQAIQDVQGKNYLKKKRLEVIEPGIHTLLRRGPDFISHTG